MVGEGVSRPPDTHRAMMTTWRIDASLTHSLTASGTRGAKHEVVDRTQSTRRGPPSSSSWARSPSTSVLSSSPSCARGRGMGVSPAVRMALRQDFWSMRGQSTTSGGRWGPSSSPAFEKVWRECRFDGLHT